MFTLDAVNKFTDKWTDTIQIPPVPPWQVRDPKHNFKPSCRRCWFLPYLSTLISNAFVFSSLLFVLVPRPFLRLRSYGHQERNGKFGESINDRRTTTGEMLWHHHNLRLSLFRKNKHQSAFKLTQGKKNLYPHEIMYSVINLIEKWARFNPNFCRF